MSFQTTEVDGVPTLVAANSGQTVAGLVFRVGRADETLARSGLTHLLEHLAMHPLGLTDYHYNGTTGSVTTSFHTAGSADDVSAFLTKVCDSLAALPFARLETEKSIIRTEWSSRNSSVYQDMPLWRYGARGYGLLSYSEPGIGMITADELEHWRRSWFTRENAVLWVAGQIPPGLRLNLPSGQRWGLPTLTSSLPATPAYYPSERQVVAFTAIVPRSPAVGVFAEVFERNLFRDLRQEDGLSYSAAVSGEHRGDGFATVTAGVDALPEKLDGALGGFIDVLARLRAGRIDDADMTAYLAKLRDSSVHPDAEAGLLPDAAVDLLVGAPPRDLARRLAELEAVTLADVHTVAKQTWDSGLLMVPQGRTADWAGFVAAPQNSAETLTGPKIASRQTDHASLYVNGEGVSRTYHDSIATVRFSEVAAMMVWPDGARRLIGNDAITVHIEPTMWELPPGAIAHMDASVPYPQVILNPAREPDEIPQPKPATAAGSVGSAGSAATAGAQPTKAGWSGGELAGLIASIAVGVAVLCLAGILTAAAASDNGSADDIGWGVPIGSWVCMAIVFVPTIVLIVRHRRKRRAAA